MNKLNCIDNYYYGTRACYLNLIGDFEKDPRLKKYIVDEKNLLSSQVSLISLLMLGIKEDIVENVGNLKFDSLVLDNYMEDSIKFITKKIDDKYYIKDNQFDNPSNIVALIRNKLGHGEYYINYENKSVVLIDKGKEIEININKLSRFIVSSLGNYLKHKKSKKITRSFCSNNKIKKNNDKLANTDFELKNIIRGLTYYKVTLSTDKDYIPDFLVDEFEEFIKNYQILIKHNKHNEYYNNFNLLVKNFNCSLNIETSKKMSNETENKLISYGKYLAESFENISYENQVKLLCEESLKYYDNKFKKLDTMVSILRLLHLLEYIKTTKTSDINILSSYIATNNLESIMINYNEIGTVLISMFNSLFIYPFEDVYTTSGGYKLNRTGVFDFSILNFDKINPIIDGIDRRPIELAKDDVRVLEKEYDKINNSIISKTNQLNNINGKPNLEELLKNTISKLNVELQKVNIKLTDKKNDCYEIEEDYRINHKYFKNRAIINGIRNSIAHGHYEFIPSNKLVDTKIIFTDLYEGKETFKLEITYEDFSSILEDSFQILLEYINNKKIIKKKTL